jgi:elongation factor P
MADTLDTTAFRRGLKIEIDRDPWEIVEFQHVKPGKGSAFVRTRIKNLLTGRTIDKTFKSGDVVGKPDLEEKEMQFLYREGTTTTSWTTSPTSRPSSPRSRWVTRRTSSRTTRRRTSCSSTGRRSA